MSGKLTAAVLKRQDDVCSSSVLLLLRSCQAFQQLSRVEGDAIVRRDREDEEKLAAGIDIAIRKGILQGKPDVPRALQINVVGLSAQQVTEKILCHLPSREGNVIVLQGLSGTGKGTTVAKLKELLPRCVTWSNGNIFRSYTYLCQEMLSKEGKTIEPATLTPQLIAAVARRVTFVKGEDGSYQTLIDDKVRVRDIENTALKAPLISAKVPTVAEQTQGEVIRFGADAVQRLSADGFNVILEGRAQTLNYIPTSERFELVIPDVATLGQRRAAQRVMAKALELVQARAAGLRDDADVSADVFSAVEAL